MNQRIIKDITDFIFVCDEPQKSDVIFIPGSSNWEVAYNASQLYNNGYCKYIVPSGKYPLKMKRFHYERIANPDYYGEFETECSFVANVLSKNNVPSKAIIHENKATHTLENAIFSKAVLDTHKIAASSAIICCKAFHARRALISYSTSFPDTMFYVVPTSTQGISSENWYKTDSGINQVMSELEKCGKYFNDKQFFG